ncbi:hypothetical protein Aduo_001060 [Ancylostoma duodenale]
MSDNVEIEKELEQLLAEPSTDDRIVRMEANLEKLVDHVTCMSRAAMQVRASTVAIKEQIAQLSEIPRLIAEELRVGTSRKAHKKAEEIRCIVDSRLQMPRKAILLELQKIVSALGESQKMPDLLSLKESAKSADQIRNAAQREQNSRAHARRVGYESQMEQAAGKHDRDVFQEAVPSPCMPSTSNNDAFRHAYQQLNAGDFAHVSYEAEFDPIRAGEELQQRREAAENDGVELIHVEAPPVQRSPSRRQVNSHEHKIVVERKSAQTHTQHSQSAFVSSRVYLRPGETKSIPVFCNATEDGVIWSKCNIIPDMVCRSGQHQMQVNVTNDLAGARLFRRGEEIGHYEPGISDGEPLECFNNMLEKTSPISAGERAVMLSRILQEKESNNWVLLVLAKIASDFGDVFAVSDQELTQTNVVEHSIETGEAAPIKQKARPIPLSTKLELKKILGDLQERGVIEPSSSSWASPIVLVRKKDGSLRLCVDYRKVNQVTKIDCYPLPTIDTILQNLKGKTWFSTLDLSSGYWQIKLADDTKEKSAFTTTEGLYQFRVLPFGLASSPAVFQRLMHAVLSEILGDEVSCYLDDVMVATCSKERHVEVLSKVFEALRKANLKLNPWKCKLFKRRVDFLGHVIDEEGLHTDPAKVKSILQYPLPKDRTELRTFLGMCSYYRKFVLGFSKVAGELHEMTSEKRNFTWTPSRVAAFEKLKEIIASAPVLAQPDVEAARSGKRPFRIHTDASYYGLGAVLSQEGEDGLQHPVFFASKGLSKSEKGYHITDLEALAVVFALRKFHMFVYGLPVEVYTDHQALTALFRRSNVSARVLRWALELQKYDLRMIYLKGAANKVADALSRGATSCDEVEQSFVTDELIVAATTQDAEWLKLLRKDPVYSVVIKGLETGDLHGDVELRGYSRKLKVADFTLADGKLLLLRDHVAVEVVPKQYRRKVFDDAHSGLLAGHFGPRKVFRILSKRVFWETMKRDVWKWTRERRDCVLHNAHQKMTPPLKPIIAAKPYEIVGIDILEMGPTSNGNRYILAVIDHFTKYGGAYAIPSKSAELIARVFFERWIADGGRLPKQLLSDQGPEFDNKVLSELCTTFGLKQIFTKGYNPRENGLTERFNRTLLGMLRKKVKIPVEWDRLLPYCVLAYNTTPHETTGESPYFLLHGFDAALPWETLQEKEVTTYMVDLEEYIQELLVGTNAARSYAAEQSAKARSKMKAHYDRTKQVCRAPPRVGERVYLRVPTEKQTSSHQKLANEWTGPYRILETSENSALITAIGSQDEPLRMPFDALMRVPKGISDEPDPHHYRQSAPSAISL